MRVPVTLTAAGLALLVASTAIAEEPAAPAQPAAKQAAGDQVVCRRIQDSSSLARRTRVCRTRAQWDRMADAQRNNSPGMTAATGSTSGN